MEGREIDTWSSYEAVSLVKDWRYDGFRLWTKPSWIDEGFLHVFNDVQVIAVAKHNIDNKVDGHIWVEHDV